jgi:hypothetical protein
MLAIDFGKYNNCLNYFFKRRIPKYLFKRHKIIQFLKSEWCMHEIIAKRLKLLSLLYKSIKRICSRILFRTIFVHVTNLRYSILQTFWVPINILWKQYTLTICIFIIKFLNYLRKCSNQLLKLWYFCRE